MPPTPPMDMPPMGGPNDMGEDPMAGGPEGEMPNDGEPNEGGAGQDVKEYSGELSQALNTYNQENPSDEEHVNKYAINMIAAQVADYLSDKDKRSVIKKLKGDEADMSSDEQPQMGGMPQPQMESRIVKEIADELINGMEPMKRDEKLITNKEINKKRNPFISKDFAKRS